MPVSFDQGHVQAKSMIQIEYFYSSFLAIIAIRTGSGAIFLFPPYSPESNGKADRLNRTLTDMDVFMLKNMTAENSEKFGVEGIRAAIRNIRYTKACATRQTPPEALHGIKPDLSHIWVFESKAFVHKPMKRQTWKHDGKGEEVVLVVFDRGTSFRIFMPALGSVIVSPDVTFDKSKRDTRYDDTEKIQSILFDLDVAGRGSTCGSRC